MKLYKTPTGRWEGTQDDARAAAKAIGSTWSPCDVPVDKAGLLAFLNDHRVGAAQTPVQAPSVIPAVTQPEPPSRPPNPKPGAAPAPRDMSAEAVLSRMDQPKLDVDGVVSAIMFAKPYALKRFAGAVAMAYQSLTR